MRSTETKICIECGKPFKARVNNQLICSNECRLARRKRQVRERYDELQRITFCPICGNPMTYAQRKRKYCSDECAAIAVKHQKKQYKERQKSIGSPCENCGHADGCKGTCIRWDDWFVDSWEYARGVVIEKCAEGCRLKRSVWGANAGVSESVIAARAAGLSYGRYMAERYMEKEGAAK